MTTTLEDRLFKVAFDNKEEFVSPVIALYYYATFKYKLPLETAINTFEKHYQQIKQEYTRGNT